MNMRKRFINPFNARSMHQRMKKRKRFRNPKKILIIFLLLGLALFNFTRSTTVSESQNDVIHKDNELFQYDVLENNGSSSGRNGKSHGTASKVIDKTTEPVNDTNTKIVAGNPQTNSAKVESKVEPDSANADSGNAIAKERMLSKPETSETPPNSPKAEGQASPPNNANASTSTGIANETTPKIPTFESYPDTVIVTKVFSKDDLKKLQQMLCLLSNSYNDRVKYDVVVFTSIPWDREEQDELLVMAKGAEVTVVVETGPLSQQLEKLGQEELQLLRKRCGLEKSDAPLTFSTLCSEEGSQTSTTLGYSWTAEFRAYHIWNHPAIEDYEYMIWFDSDALVSKWWSQDPMKVMVDNNLAVLYSGFPDGNFVNPKLKEKMNKVYGKSICSVGGGKDQKLFPIFCQNPDEKVNIDLVAGYHHITNLNVFRKDIHRKFLKELTGDYRFSKQWGDQLAITIVGLMDQHLTQEVKMMHERSNNLTLKIAHHNMYDSVPSEVAPENVSSLFKTIVDGRPSLKKHCEPVF